MKKVLIALFVVAQFGVFGQDYIHEDYTWEASPSFSSVDSIELIESYVVLKDFHSLEYVDNPLGLSILYEVIHKVVKVNDDRGIQSFNKVYIPANHVDIKEVKARSISPTGAIQEISDEDIKEVEIEAYGKFKIFAIQGLQPGSIVEYYYKAKGISNSYWGREIIQEQGKVKEATFQLICPEHLEFNLKGYNGIPEIIDSTDEERHYYGVTVLDIKPAYEEKYAAYRANLMRIEYTVSKNKNKTNEAIYGWESAAPRFYSIYIAPDKKEDKAVKKALKKTGPDVKNLSELEKIKAIEVFYKSPSVVSVDPNQSGKYGLASIALEEGIANQRGITLLYTRIFNLLDIEYQLVFTTDKMSTRFDPDFESWAMLQEPLLYFPKHDKFMEPANAISRLGMITPNYADNYGLFIYDREGIPKAKTKYIEPTTVDNNFDKMELDLKFNDNFKDTKIDVKRTMSGHSSYNLKPQLPFATEEQLEQILNQFVKFMGEDGEVLNREEKGTDPAINAIDQPLEISGTVEINSLVERAGKNYLFKIGEVIGEQVEMYQEKKRVNQAEIEYPHQYIRDITFNVPDGYQVKGLEELNIDISYGKSDDGSKTMGFVSNYKESGNQVTVHIDEYYRTTTYPLEQFEEFREVINAAADFNKIVVIFEKI